MSRADPNEWRLLTGMDEPPPEHRPLRAGPLTLTFESGGLRYIKLGGREVVRRIYAAVRDRNWGTVPSEISNLKFEISEESFFIGYTSTHRRNEVHFVWRAEIVGDLDSTIRFNFNGEAQSTFLRNRIGFCVLHPIRECAGTKCRALYLDRVEKELTFPENIASEQPMRGLHDLAGLAHEVEPGLWAELLFEGDAFEMEDQRNWIDASFKTYCTPLRLPFPMEIKAGTRVQQSVTLRLVEQASRLFVGRASSLSKTVNATPEIPADSQKSGAAGGTPTGRHRQDSCATSVAIRLAGVRVKLPPFGLGASSDKSPGNFPDKARLGSLHLSHLRHDVRLASPDWGHELHCASIEAKSLELPLELAVHLPASPNDRLAELAAWHEEPCSRFPKLGHIIRFLVFQDGEKSTTDSALDAVRLAFGKFAIPIGAGTNTDHYELNLKRPPAEADFIVWSMNPQVHAFDNASIAETPEAAAQQVANVRHLFPGKPVVVSPVTLKPRFNAVATGPEPPTPHGELPPQVDPRQVSLFGAAWTLAMLKVLSEGGVSSMTFYETTGWRGVMETLAGSPLPGKFPSTPGAVFPLYHVLADVAEFAGGEVLLTTSDEPLTVQSLMLRHGKRRRLLLANLQPCAVRTVLTGPGLESPFRMRRLNTGTAQEAMRQPDAFRNSGQATSAWTCEPSLALAPYELATVDFD